MQLAKRKQQLCQHKSLKNGAIFAQIVGFHKSDYIVIIYYNYRLCGMKPLDGQLALFSQHGYSIGQLCNLILFYCY